MNQSLSGHLSPLKTHLDILLDTAPLTRWLQNDPVRFPRLFSTPEDREIVAVYAALIAYGRVSSIGNAMASILERMGDTPALNCATDCKQAALQRFDGFVYRVTRGVDLARLWLGLGALIRRHGTLLSAFEHFDQDRAPDFRSVLSHFRKAVFEHTHAFDDRRGFRHFLPDPQGGSAIKRYNMFMRWMVRGPDTIDMGDWSSLGRHRLMLPLDTHTHSIATRLGLTDRKQADWRTTSQITSILRLLCPEDPVKYDFALAHLGISGDIEQVRWQKFVTDARIMKE